jgi:hypothetical protein
MAIMGAAVSSARRERLPALHQQQPIAAAKASRQHCQALLEAYLEEEASRWRLRSARGNPSHS